MLAIIAPDTKGAAGTMRDKRGEPARRVSFVIGGKLKGPLSVP